MRLWLVLAAAFLVRSLPADPGFFPLTAREIPKKVVDVSKSSFRALFFREKATLEVTADSVARLKTALKDEPLKAMRALGHPEDTFLAKVLEKDVAALPAGAVFPVHVAGVATAFFVKPGWLVTARHALHGVALSKSYSDAKNAADARKAIGEWKGRLVLIDREGVIRFDSAAGKQGIRKVVFSGHPAELDALPPVYAKVERTAKGQMTDLVAFELDGFDSKELQLELATEAPKAGDTLFAIGFPMRTERKSGDAAPDADGNSLRVSLGKVSLNAPADYQTFLKGLMEDEPRALYEQSLVLSDADFFFGVGGGPCVNAGGQLVSIVSTVRHDPKQDFAKKYSVTASYGPRLSLLYPLFAK